MTQRERQGWLIVASLWVTEVFGVKLSGEGGRANQVAEQHRQLAALSGR